MSSLLSRITAPVARLSRRAPDPGRDWRILLIAFGVILIITIGWNVWAFETVVDGGTLGDTHKIVAPVETTSALDTLPALLDTRAAEDSKYINGGYRFADPSQ